MPQEPMSKKQLISPGESAIQYIGRVVQLTDISGRTRCRFDWPGTEIRFTVKGSKSVNIKMNGANNFFNVSLNSGPPTVLACDGGLKEYPVANDLNPNLEYKISIYKRTEAVAQFPDRITGCVSFAGVLLDQEAQLIRQTEIQPRRIEFVGDSDTAAYGNLGPRTGFEVEDRTVFADPSLQDTSKSWAALVANAFEAECHNISWSGMGAVWNAPGMSVDGAMDQHYHRLIATEGNQPSTLATPDNPVLPPVDLIVLYIGSNDWWTVEERGDKAFVDGYVKFLASLRELRPGQPILVLAANENSGSCLMTLDRQRLFSDDMKRLLGRAVEGAGGETESIHLREVHPSPSIDLSLDEDWGLMEHWSVAAHEKWARGVIPLIEEFMK